ncbi:MAG: ABC transporter substrate-binding protein [Bacteroidota bacterium]|nr:ABC transporter substrate-binding protein [Bacteroidota bacterium]
MQPSIRFSLICAVLLWGAGVCAAQALPRQSVEVEEAFAAALGAYEAEDYAGAFFGFRDVYERDPVHTKTTAAHLMAGKALYRHGDHQAAIDLLQEFIREYSSSRYREEAERVIAAARIGREHKRVNDSAINLGLALPLSRDELPLTQSIFSGVQLAIENYNSRHDPKIRIVFRDTKNSEAGARSAANALVNEGVSAIIGPLFSDQVHSAARSVEQQQTVMIAPLATDGQITRGRRYVFQVNATLAERGRYTARQAVDYLKLRDIGIIVEADNPMSEEMARGFEEELGARELTPTFVYQVGPDSDWIRSPNVISSDSLRAVEGIYLAIHRDNELDASRLVGRTVINFRRRGVRPIILGSLAWPSLDLNNYNLSMPIYYTDVYYVNDLSRSVRNFVQKYEVTNGGAAPDRLAYVGYDVASMILENLDEGDISRERLLGASLYEGLSIQIQFGDNQRNTEFYFFRHTPNGPQRVR